MLLCQSNQFACGVGGKITHNICVGLQQTDFVTEQLCQPQQLCGSGHIGRETEVRLLRVHEVEEMFSHRVLTGSHPIGEGPRALQSSWRSSRTRHCRQSHRLDLIVGHKTTYCLDHVGRNAVCSDEDLEHGLDVQHRVNLDTRTFQDGTPTLLPIDENHHTVADEAFFLETGHCLQYTHPAGNNVFDHQTVLTCGKDPLDHLLGTVVLGLFALHHHRYIGV
mmetsp:Transcript_41790/g.105378  ORF Transcript_41790/g.105378 Transcript_41790/m.105378 type:complete len:221 (+) Transcript_41790:1982-2644(+)